MAVKKSGGNSGKGKNPSPASKKKSSSQTASAAKKSAKKPASKSAKRAPAKQSSAKKSAPKKHLSEAEIQLQCERFIRSVVLFFLSILFMLMYFIPGEKLWWGFHQLFRGLFGTFGFIVPFITLYASVQNFKDKPANHYKLKTFLLCTLPFFLSASIFSFNSGTTEFGDYFEEIYNSFVNATNYEGTGIAGGIIGIPLVKLMGSTGGGIICIFMLLISFAFVFDAFTADTVKKIKKPVKRAGERINEKKEVHRQIRTKQQEIKDQQRKKANEEYIQKKVEETRKKVERKRNGGVPENFSRISYSGIYNPLGNKLPESKYKNTENKIENKNPAKQPKPQQKPIDTNINTNYNDGFDASSEMPVFADNINITGVSFDEEKIRSKQKSESKLIKENKKTSAPKTEIIPDNPIIEGQYIKPPFTLLEPQPIEEEGNISMELNQSGTMLVDTLKSFGVQTTIVNISRGPSVTRYELQPASGVKISKITNLADDIAMNLAAIGVRIEAPIPGKSAVGIEVPNKNVSIVKMRSLMESNEFQTAKSKLTVALGMDITGKITLADLGKMPHLLIAGSTGSGKSVCINSMLVSLLYKANPDEVKLMLIDPKVVELGVYNGIPHLLVPVVTDPRKAAGALNWAVNEMLNRYKTFAEYNVRDMHSYNRMVDRQNAEIEMHENVYEQSERSFEEDEMLAQAQAEVQDSSDKPDEPKQLQKMPQIVIIIDELADLMMAAPNEVEESICRLAQMARAAGMHLVIATQRPSVDVITGLIKANVPSRIAFAVKSQIDSRTILDGSGAEKLLGRGDMLFSPIGTTKPIRVQGCYVDDIEIENIIEFIKKNKVVEYDKDVIDEIEKNSLPENSGKGSSDSGDGEYDPVMEDAIRCVVEAGQASTSMLQRRFRLGYARAGRLIDDMEQMGIVGPHEGAKPRQVLMTYQQWLERNMNKSDDEE